MKWRYQNLRIVLHRPVLLNLVNRSTGTENQAGGFGGSGGATPAEIQAVNTCRQLAKQTIEDIFREWTPNQMLGWNAAWFLYQAVMVPLVSLFWERWNGGEGEVEWKESVELVLEAMEGLGDWSLAAKRSREVVGKMFEAWRRGSDGDLISSTVQTGNPVNGISYRNGHVNGGGTAFLSPGMSTSMNPPNGTVGAFCDGYGAQMEMFNENLLDQNIWDLDGMLWGNLQDGLDMPYDDRMGMAGMEFDDAGYAGHPVGYDSAVNGDGYSMH
jgi:hypothetical protein